jgi:tripartite-type tricarboxylate transporter receptor subunit TctC
VSPRLQQRRRCLSSLVALATLGLPWAALQAQSAPWPTRPIKLVVSQPPGGTMDIVSRLVADQLKDLLGQPVVVENKPGANGNIAAGEVARSPANGYTLIMGTGATHTINPFLYERIGFDPVADFTPIANLVSTPNVISISGKEKMQTLQEVIAYARQRPGKLNYASAGTGGTGQLTMELLKSEAKISITHIAYRGIAAAVQDTIAGTTELLAFPPAALLPHFRSGALRPLAVTSATRIPQLPDTPTVAELGFVGFEGVAWFGVLAPAGLPDTVAATLTAALEKAVANPEFVTRMSAQGLSPSFMPGPQFAAYMKQDAARWRHVIRVSGARVE